ncbi:hypothetical protein ACXR2T_01245 [Leucobacter sp. HY1910]
MDEAAVSQPGEASTVAAIDALLQKNSITEGEMMEYLAASEDAMTGLHAKRPDYAAALGVGLQVPGG